MSVLYNVLEVLFSYFLNSLCTGIEFAVSGFAVLAVSGLACFHTNLIATMKTTNEDVNSL